jgi:DNA-binding HxlR family transcriptional regulator
MAAEDDIADDRRRAEVFDSLSHPTRILILKALNEGPLGFADLKKKLGIESSGHLQHHLSKLGILVKTDEYGKYALSDQGKDALLSVETVEKVAESRTKEKKKAFGNGKRKLVWRIPVIALALLLVASSVIAIFEYNQTLSLQNQLRKKEGTINDLSNSLRLAQQTAYINADGSVKGTNNIQRSGNLYLLTGNISGSIIVQKSNIIIDGEGYALQGFGGTGIDLTNNVTQVPSSREIWNVTIKNLAIINFDFSIQTNGGGNDTLYHDYIANTTNGFASAVFIFGSGGNNITYCTINGTPAVFMQFGSSHNTITENNLSGGVWLEAGDYEIVDRNYWSDYLTKYPNATEVDSSGTWDVPYHFTVYGSSFGDIQDNHPLMKPVSIPNFGSPPLSSSTIINPSPSIPEFPTLIILPLLVAVMTLLSIVFVRKRIPKNR